MRDAFAVRSLDSTLAYVNTSDGKHWRPAGPTALLLCASERGDAATFRPGRPSSRSGGIVLHPQHSLGILQRSFQFTAYCSIRAERFFNYVPLLVAYNVAIQSQRDSWVTVPQLLLHYSRGCTVC